MMARVITPPPADLQEAASKNWYRAESLRKVLTDLSNVYVDVENVQARREIYKAIASIEEARCILNPALRPPMVKKVRSR